MEEFLLFFQEYPLLIICALIFLLLLLYFVLLLRVAALGKRYREFMTGNTGGSLEETLSALLADLKEIKADIVKNRQQMACLREKAAGTIQGLGVVRYNAFWDAGGELSFAVALLDGKNNGVVISSICGREETRIYAKPVQNGSSQYRLSDEEKDAILKAQKMLKPALSRTVPGKRQGDVK